MPSLPFGRRGRGTRRFRDGEGEVGAVGALQSPPHPGPNGQSSLDKLTEPAIAAED